MEGGEEKLARACGLVKLRVLRSRRRGTILPDP